MVMNQVITDRYAFYNGDSAEWLQSLPAESIHLSVYSPPFGVDNDSGGGGALYNYSSSERDLSNARSYAEFMDHYGYIVEQIARVTLPGRMSAVHCMDVPKDGANICGYSDFPGDIIRLHAKHGFEYTPRINIWKEPLAVRNRTMSKALAHRQIVEDSTLTNVACADYLIPFRKSGKNPIPVTHPTGLARYAGSRQIPADLMQYKDWTGNQIQNRYSHWIWRNYASCFWDDIRLDRVLPYKEGRDEEDERHMHPLQLDVIERACVLWSNPGEKVMTPFAGVGSELAGALMNGRLAIGCELKPSYFNQGVRNLSDVAAASDNGEELSLFDASSRSDVMDGAEVPT